MDDKWERYFNQNNTFYVTSEVIEGKMIYHLIGGQILSHVHNPADCLGEACCIHNQSDHHMRNWPMNYRQDALIMERLCRHGIGHPDPDDPNAKTYVHGCDGCCSDVILPEEGYDETN